MHHPILEGSHLHIVYTARDANQCQRFYGQLIKQITDAVKRLLAIEHLNIWERKASVIKLPMLEDAIDKIQDCYCNPSNDDLQSSIDRYPGISSWKAFNKAKKADRCITSEHPRDTNAYDPKSPILFTDSPAR